MSILIFFILSFLFNISFCFFFFGTLVQCIDLSTKVGSLKCKLAGFFSSQILWESYCWRLLVHFWKKNGWFVTPARLDISKWAAVVFIFQFFFDSFQGNAHLIRENDFELFIIIGKIIYRLINPFTPKI